MSKWNHLQSLLMTQEGKGASKSAVTTRQHQHTSKEDLSYILENVHSRASEKLAFTFL